MKIDGGVPAVGGAKGIFELFVPGLFLLFNIVGIAYFFPPLRGPVAQLFQSGQNESPPVTAVAVAAAIIAFGYLLGVVLRSVQVELADLASAWWLRTFHCEAKGDKQEYRLWATDRFPYISYLTLVYRSKEFSPPTSPAARLPRRALEFFDLTWARRRRERHTNNEFVHLCWMLVKSANPALAAELYANESLCRYVAGMFYALVVSATLTLLLLWDMLLDKQLGLLAVVLPSWLILSLGIGYWARTMKSRQTSDGESRRPTQALEFMLFVVYTGAVCLLASRTPAEPAFPLAWSLLVYLPTIHILFRSMRFLRIKEAQALFSACFACQRELLPALREFP